MQRTTSPAPPWLAAAMSDARTGRRFAGIVTLALTAAGMFAATTAGVHAAPCPDVSGHFRVVGAGAALGDALGVLGIRSAGAAGSRVEVTGSAEVELQLWVRSGSTGPSSGQPVRRLKAGTDYVCRNGGIEFSGPTSSSRRIDETWYEGRTTLRITPDAHALNLVVSFSGSERVTVYSYDSARVSVPKPGTRRNLSETIRWPDRSVPEPEPEVRAREEVREPPEVARVRRLISDRSILGNVTLGGLRAVSGGVLVHLRAPRSGDGAQFEDRLRAASVPYELKQPPVWSNSAYELHVLVRSGSAGTGPSSRPSAFRVQQEMSRMRHPMVDVAKVIESGDAYVATLNILGRESVDTIVARLRANSSLFGDIVLIEESASPDRPGLRVAQLRLQLR